MGSTWGFLEVFSGEGSEHINSVHHCLIVGLKGEVPSPQVGGRVTLNHPKFYVSFEVFLLTSGYFEYEVDHPGSNPSFWILSKIFTMFSLASRSSFSM